MADWLNNSTTSSIGDPLNFSGQFGMGGTWYDPMNVFGTGKGLPNPADAAQGYFNQVPGTIKPYYDPYIDAGKSSLSSVMGQYSSLVNDPGSVMNNAAKGFHTSPGYQFNLNQGTNAINNAAAAGGMLGTPNHQMQAGQMASNLANGEYNNYLGNALNMYQTGLQGQQGINQMGYNASNELAQSLATNLMNQGQLAYLGQESQNKGKQGGLKNFMGVAGSLFGI